MKVDVNRKKSKRRKNKKTADIWTIPNILSFIRLLMIPLIVWLYICEKNYVWTTIVLAISALTDIVDGYIARHFHQISNFGKALDPVADKLTQIAMLFCLSTNHPKMWVPVILLIIKEVSAGITNLVIIKKKHEVHGAVWHGKVTTVLLYTMMILHAIWADIPEVLSTALICGSVVMMLISLVLYTKRNIHILKR